MSALSLAARRAAPLFGRRAFSTAKPAPAPGLKNVVLVDGCRTPFQPACTAYNDLMAYDLARLALRGLMTKTGVSPDSVDYVFMGTVLQEVRTSRWGCTMVARTNCAALALRDDGAPTVRPRSTS